MAHVRRQRHIRVSLLAVACMLGGCQSEIIGNLDQRSAREIEFVLLKNGMKADVTTGKNGLFAIAVDQANRLQALGVVAEAGLPQTEYASLEKMFPGTGFVVTPIEQKARLTYAVEQEIAQTLSSIEGVRSARVHVVMSEDNGRGLVQQKARAAALISYHPGVDTGTIEQKARTLILNSVRNLDFEDVSVVVTSAPDERGRVLDHAMPTMPAAGPGVSKTGIAAIGLGLALLCIGLVRLFGLPTKRPGSRSPPRASSAFTMFEP